VNDEGSYCGGAIAPGINLSLEALHRAAAKLPRVAVEPPESVIGTSTVSAMQSGVFWGYVGLIEGLVGRIQHEYGKPMTTIATGGLAPLFAKRCPVLQHVDRDLTMAGLLEMYALNRELVRSGKGTHA
jgi:type III pantothenate kinase